MPSCHWQWGMEVRKAAQGVTAIHAAPSPADCDTNLALSRGLAVWVMRRSRNAESCSPHHRADVWGWEAWATWSGRRHQLRMGPKSGDRRAESSVNKAGRSLGEGSCWNRGTRMESRCKRKDMTEESRSGMRCTDGSFTPHPPRRIGMPHCVRWEGDKADPIWSSRTASMVASALATKAADTSAGVFWSKYANLHVSAQCRRR